MIIRCWGARGSIPVSGKEYMKYGGDTTCIEIRTKNDEIIIIDAGSGIRRLGNRLLAEKKYHFTLLFTHAHWDHLMGFPFFKPIYLKETNIDIIGCPFAQDTIKQMISKIMQPPNFPLNFDDIHAKTSYYKSCENVHSLKSMTIEPIALSHPNQGMGYKFTEDGKSFVFLTDNELMFKHPGGLDYRGYVDFCMNSDVLIHDAEFKKEEYKKRKTWGHSVYTDALQLALDAKVKTLGLFHHNQDRSDQAIDSMLDDCRTIINKSRSPLRCFALYQDMEIKL
jgi:phosphoribosyl 1,2-cyclic phosphodiesterase